READWFRTTRGADRRWAAGVDRPQLDGELARGAIDVDLDERGQERPLLALHVRQARAAEAAVGVDAAFADQDGVVGDVLGDVGVAKHDDRVVFAELAR